MPDRIDEQLVQQIVERVLEAIAREQAGQTSAPGDATGSPRAGRAGHGSVSVRPPAGVCTGDYSKFAELAGRAVGAAPPSATGAPPQQGTGPHSPMPLTGIVTAQQLQAAIDGDAHGVARLAHDARLTPLANDFARQHPEKIRRVGRPAPAAHPHAAADAAAPASSPWLWWADAHAPAVQALTLQLGPRLRPSAVVRSDSGLGQVVADLAAAVDAQHVAGGLLFVRSAAKACCFANRCRPLRAVVGTCLESVEQAIDQLGANVLIIEHPYTAPQTIEAMVRRIIDTQPTLPADVQRHLNELDKRR